MNILHCLKFIIIIIVFISTLSHAQIYSFETLTSSNGKFIASQAIQKFMINHNKEDIEECLNRNTNNDRNINNYFNSIRINLGDKKYQYYLIFPSVYCDQFFGAHSTKYWILKKNKLDISILYTGNSDSLAILKTKTNGLFDLESSYGGSYIILIYKHNEYINVFNGLY